LAPAPRTVPSLPPSPQDLVFLLHHIITFSFLRQSITLYILRPWALRLGINKQAKIARFMEQSYSALYYGTAGATGFYLMYHYLPTWCTSTASVLWCLLP
jgi:acyl-CoA-dependent ceramide synthase